jgi:hypothetical protein
MTDEQHPSVESSSGPPTAEEEPIPLGQRLFDSPFLLLIACTVVMFVFFTGWGLWEIFTLPEAPLP